MRKTLSTQAISGKWRTLVSGALLPLLLTTGCAGMNNTGTGAVAGTAIGAGAGAAIGSAFHAPVVGALIGGGTGLLAGSAIGQSIDNNNEKKAVQQVAAQQAADQAEAQRNAPTLLQIQQMSAGGTSDTIIINQIRASRYVYQLRPEDILWLQQNGVHDAVIAEMQATATRSQTVIYQPVPVRDRVIIYDDPPPVRIGFGYGWGHRW